MSLFSEWQRHSDLSEGLDRELASRPGLAAILVRQRFPLLHLFVEESHKRLLARMAREEFGADAMNRIIEISRYTTYVAALSMWRTAWAEVLPTCGSAGGLRATSRLAPLDRESVLPPEEVAWHAVRRAYGSFLRLLPFPEELEDQALAVLPHGEGVGVDAEQLYSDSNLAAGFYLCLNQSVLDPYPSLCRYVDRQLQRVGFILARHYVTSQLARVTMRFGRAVVAIAALSVWHSVQAGLERGRLSTPMPQPLLFDLGPSRIPTL
jgi:hypothetical protein